MSSAVETTWLNCNLSFMVQSRKDGDARGGVANGYNGEEHGRGPRPQRCSLLAGSTCTSTDTRISHHVTTILRILGTSCAVRTTWTIEG